MPTTLDQLLASGLDWLAQGREGYVVTEAVALAGFARNRAALRAAYDAAPGAIDAWARQIDTQAVVGSLMGSETVRQLPQTLAARYPLAFFATGAACGFVVARMLR